MGKKGKGKGKAESADPAVDKKGKKGKKGKKASAAAPVAAAPPPPPPPVAAPPVEEAPPEPEKKCADKLEIKDPCRYDDSACCKDIIACRPNAYPGILAEPLPMAVAGSECGSYTSLCKLLTAGLRCADRVLALTPWGNYVVFRSVDGERSIYFLFDGCTCNVNRFRYLDLHCGTAGLLYFRDMHDVITYIISSRRDHLHMQSLRKTVVDDILKEFCEFGPRF